MAYKINGTTVVDNSRNVCACCVTSCCITASSRMDAPSGTTANRPASPATGSLYFDTDLGSLISYNGTDWATVGGGGDFQYQWSFFFMGGHQDPFEAQCQNQASCFYCANDAPSAIYPHIDGGWDAITSVDAFHSITCYDWPYQITYTTSRPVEGTSGTIASFNGPNTEVWKCGANFTRTFSTPISMTSPIPFGGLTPTSSKILYSLATPVRGPTPAFNPYLCYAPLPEDECAGVLGFIEPNGTLSLKIRCYCICCCTNCIGGIGYSPMSWVGAMNTVSSGCNYHCCQHVWSGDQCCGFAMASGVNTGPSCMCSGRTYFWTIGGFNHDYFLKDDTTATEANSPMKATIYCACNDSFPFQYNPVFDYENKRFVGIVNGRCAGGFAVWCLCNTSCENTACWELCTSPYYASMNCQYGNLINTKCTGRYNPGDLTWWAGYLWGVTSPDSSQSHPALWRTNSGSVQGWCFKSGGGQPTCAMPTGIFIDCDCNMRLFAVAGDTAACLCKLVEIVIPCCVGVNGSFHTCTGAAAMCVYTYCMKFGTSGCMCCFTMSAPFDFQKNCACQHYNTLPPSKFTQALRYDCANNRVAVNNFIKYGCCCHKGRASMLIPVFPNSCTGNKQFFSDNPYLCIERVNETTCRVYAPSCCINGFLFCCMGSCGGGTSYPACCISLCKLYSTGISLCSGFKCYLPDRLMSPLMFGCQCMAIGASASMTGFTNNCCYFLGS